MKRQKRGVGDVLGVPLSENRMAFAIVLPIADIFFEFFPQRNRIPQIEEIIRKPILFQICVMDYAVTRGIWKIIGHVDPPPHLLEPPKFFKQDHFSGKLTITTDGSNEVPAGYEECIGLEKCAAWDPEHVVSRLEDYLAGRPNKWYELQRPKRITT